MKIKEIQADKITAAVAELCIRANYELGMDVVKALKNAFKSEESSVGRDILQQIIDNAAIASEEQVPMCQDTGFTVVFLEIGQDVHIVDGDLTEAVNRGVAKGYEEGYLRSSIVAHPLERTNTGDNTPAVIHTEIVPGSKIKIIVAPKGGGSENMSAVRMLKPSDGVQGIKDFVVETVKRAGSNSCPPVIVGIGIGGTMEKAALLAKKALLREVGKHSPKASDARLEEELLTIINDTGIGPAGLGGRITALSVNMESYPCHIASLPVAVNLQCHASRHKEVTL